MSDFPTFEELDTDSDGKVSYEEMRRFHTRQPMPFIPPEWLADTDRDQTITKEEYETFKSRFDLQE
jgi:Ca2+-binding EF-hand superfamily protein